MVYTLISYRPSNDAIKCSKLGSDHFMTSLLLWSIRVKTIENCSYVDLLIGVCLEVHTILSYLSDKMVTHDCFQTVSLMLFSSACETNDNIGFKPHTSMQNRKQNEKLNTLMSSQSLSAWFENQFICMLIWSHPPSYSI